LFRKKQYFFLSNFDVFGSVYDLFRDLLIAPVLIVDTNIAKCLPKVFVAVVFAGLLKILQMICDVVSEEGLDVNCTTYLLKSDLFSLGIDGHREGFA